MTKELREIRNQEILALRAEGMTCEQIGNIVGLTRWAVGNILGDRQKHGSTNEHGVLKEPKHQPAPDITTNEVLKIAEKIYKETGRYPSYGKVVQGIENGSIDPWQYIRRKRRAI